MATEKLPFDQDALDQEALLRQLGGATTMPVGTRDPLQTSANAPRLTQANGQTTLTEHGNQRPLQGGEVGDAEKYVADFWQQFPTGFQPDNPNSLDDAYQQFTGRPADPEGLEANAKNPGGFVGAINAIAGSPEAQTYGASGGGPTAPSAPPSSAPYTGFTPKYAFEGFNFGREQNPAKSAKDAFAQLANQAPPPPIDDKAKLGQWFETYIKPGMDKLGHTVSSVNGDTFTYGNHEGTFTVDYGRGAGAQGGALAWQASPAGGVTTTPTGTGAVEAPTTQTSAAPISTQGQSPLDQILAEVQALQSGGQSPMDTQALLRLLQGEQV